ncbi:glycerophosphodiester phosphodiesterase family protein [Chitinophaga sp. Cy-1792]|uniref:glycerophosphodiester phosphodiesterase family protein n=1 Tax=Chitinophaga sp. Cy-1792 TaxID=2608339 RepID=UPI00141D7B60|nr:glycerophosphodiester phosphodiesterase family protein [Chitinophaga sp. Cy-1792]NIG52821.1 glycerophosphodiester phosphodiesterase [Chitinophaga sp. Cy-1792]
MKAIFPMLLSAALFTGNVQAQTKLDVQAHRGGMGLMPENTIPAMINAVKLGARTLELDCIITADNKVVVSHDAFMSAAFMLKPDGSEITKDEQKTLLLYSMTYDSIRKFDAGTKHNARFPEQQNFKTYRPLLAELIDSVEHYVKLNHLTPVYYNVETKSEAQGDGKLNPAPDVFVDLVMGVINKKKIASRVTIQSFDPRTLQQLHVKFPKQQTAWLIANKESFETNIKTLGFTPNIYSPAFQLVTADLVKEAHDKKVQVLPWTVDEVDDMKKMIDLGVDGIITNYPNRLIEIVGSYQQK